MIGLIIGLVSSMLIIGFSYGSKASINERSFHQFNYGVATLYKETKQNIPGSKMSLVQMTRLNNDELYSIRNTLADFEIEPNTDALFTPLVSVGERKLEDLVFQPIYSFKNSYIDRSLLLSGELPLMDDDGLVVINKTAYDHLKKKLGGEPLGTKLHIHSDYEFHYYTNESNSPVITDFFIFDKTIEIVGVVDEFNFLSSPTIYYSYLAFKDLIQNTIAVNLSSYLAKPISWYYCIENAEESNPITSYSQRLFLKNINHQERLKDYIENIKEPYKVDSSSILVADTLLELMNAATIGMELFLVIALIGTALIMGIISFSSYSEDKKTSAILTSLGASKGDIFSIYLYENLLLGTGSLIISLILSPLLSLLINTIVFKITSFKGIVQIPMLRFMNRPLLFPVMLVVLTFGVCILSTYIPLFFSKKISPREELAEE